MKQLVYQVIWLVTFTFSMAACSTGACFEDIDPVVIVSIYSDSTQNVIACDSIKVTGLTESGDTLLVDNTSVSQFSFSLDPIHNEAKLCIALDDATDTITLTYTNYPHIVSPDCGYTIFSSISAVTTTKNIIDTITIENKSVTLNGETNLCLFY